MTMPERFARSANPRREAEPAGSPVLKLEATGSAARRYRKVFLFGAGILACILGTVAVIDLPPVLAQSQPEGAAASEADGDAAGAAPSAGQESVGFGGGMGVMGGAEGMGGFGMGSTGSAGGMGGGVMGGGMGGVRMGSEAAPSPGQRGLGFMGGMGTGRGGGMGGVGIAGMEGQSPRQVSVRFMGYSEVQSPRQELEARLAPLLNQFRQAEDDSQKETIKRELSRILEDYFDNDMKRRLSDIASIEQRMKRLRDQYEQRQQAKEEIIQLQLKVLEKEAAGLGFFGPGSPSAPAESAADKKKSQ